jgi:hypothetical protein
MVFSLLCNYKNKEGACAADEFATLPVAVRAYKLLIPKVVFGIDFHLLRKVAKIKDLHKHEKYKYFHFGQKLVTALLQI